MGLFPVMPCAGASAALQLELLRLREVNQALATQVRGYEADVAALVSLGRVGHSNALQKLQYNTGCAHALLMSLLHCLAS